MEIISWIIAIVAGAILFCRWWFKPVIPPMEPLEALPTAVDPKLAAKQPRDGKKRVAVVGGSGNIGYLVTEQLCLPGAGFDEVIIFDVRPPPQGLPESSKAKISFQKCDITNRDGMIEALSGITHVVHTAALIEIRNAPINQFRCYQVNVRGTWNVLNACILNGVQSYIFTSSTTMGQSGHRTKVEDEEDAIRRMDTMPFPSEAYRNTKIASLRLALQANGRGNLKTASVAFTINYSPYDKFIIDALRSGQFQFGHDEYGIASITSALSIAEAHVLALKKLDEIPEKVAGELFFVADVTMDAKKFYSEVMRALTGNSKIPEMNPHVWNAVVSAIGFINWLTHSTLNNPILLWTSPESDAQSRRTVYQGEPKKAMEILGFKPRPLEEGLKWLVEACHTLDAKLKK